MTLASRIKPCHTLMGSCARGGPAGSKGQGGETLGLPSCEGELGNKVSLRDQYIGIVSRLRQSASGNQYANLKVDLEKAYACDSRSSFPYLSLHSVSHLT
ncbi:hypothetical protein E2C01_014574 [Portunus trituberculatus]|uniref:Uncharacterized protein n=1 Tax=Portunus trituberculatus TaxID=210409 RepID=A0A5B7DKV7_PORTR|nr:hypothetical protein [Portunus trituberculatus]